MISWGQRHHKVISLRGKLPCRDKRHIRVSVGTDASGLDWAGCILSPTPREISDNWLPEERQYD